MRWILDDGPLGHLAITIDPEDTASWEQGLLLVAGKTAADASPKSKALLDHRVDDRPLIASFKIQIGIGDPAEEVLNALRPGTHSSADLAEHESIAWAQVHGVDAVFVCADRRAALTALAELGRGRVAHPFDLWADLWERTWLEARSFRKLCDLTRKHDQGLPRIPQRISDLFE